MKVIITGAAGGIGTAATAALRRHGATVVGLDLTGADIDCDVRDHHDAPDAQTRATWALCRGRVGGGIRGAAARLKTARPEP
jgi:nucleoside-diphosphate-sugar epimerase